MDAATTLPPMMQLGLVLAALPWLAVFGGLLYRRVRRSRP